MRLRISARSSHLARLQAYEVSRSLIHQNPTLQIEFFFRESLGDINLIDPLWKMPEKGVFTEDFYADLIEEKTDLVVHSWKDLPTERREGTMICGTLPRADQRDILLVKKSSLKRMQNMKKVNIYTSSQRRIYNLETFLKQALPFQLQDIQFESVRGNIPTRLKKLMAAEHVDGLVVAKAALDRLLSFEHADFVELKIQLRAIIQDCEWMVLPLSENPNAAAQGALAIEIKSSREDLKNVIAGIHDAKTFEAVQKERDILQSYGGGCHQKIGVAFLPRPYGWVQFLRGETDQGEILNLKKIIHTDPHPLLPKKKFILSQHKDLFTRQVIPFHLNPEVNAVYIARVSAYQKFSGFVWAAGVETWKKLAAQNVWVHGCAESLGDHEDPQIGILAGKKLVWTKLTHAAAIDSFASMPTVATYQLQQKVPFPEEMGEADNYFWMSAFHFDLAVKTFPEIIKKVHCCGPGQTAKALTKRLAIYGTKPYIFLNEKDWRADA